MLMIVNFYNELLHSFYFIKIALVENNKFNEKRIIDFYQKNSKRKLN